MGRILTDAEIGAKLRELRLDAGLTQEKLAEMLGITFQQVQKYERGVTKVNLMKLQQLAVVLKVPPMVFFDNNPCNAYSLTQDEQELLKHYRAICKKSHQTSLLDIAAGLSSIKQSR